MTEPTPQYAVLTGDLVRSSKLTLEQREAAREALRSLPERLRSLDPGASSIDIFRGDSWQMALTRPHLAPRAALLARASVRGATRKPGGYKALADTRIGIGLGPIERLSPTAISESDGPAFTVSGAVLDRLIEQRRPRHYLSCAYAEAFSSGPAQHGFFAPEALLQALLHLLDHQSFGVEERGEIVGGWTAPQALSFKGALLGKTHAEIAAELPELENATTVGRHLALAGWETVEDILALLEGTEPPRTSGDDTASEGEPAASQPPKTGSILPV